MDVRAHLTCAALGAILAGCAPAPVTKAESPSAGAALTAAAAPNAANARRQCFLLREIGGPLVVRKGDACAERHVPASTFKVPHALLAIELGARSGADDTDRWDGKDTHRAVCNRDLSLLWAMRGSCLWYFQRTAERIGEKRMAEGLVKLGYGNAAMDHALTTFWLTGPLGISAEEQVAFMERFVRRTLPVSPRAIEAVDALILQSPGKLWRGEQLDLEVTWEAPTELHAKTGSQDMPSGSVRWMIGHLDRGKQSFVFASLVTAKEELGTEAVTQATRELEEAGLVRKKR